MSVTLKVNQKPQLPETHDMKLASRERMTSVNCENLAATQHNQICQGFQFTLSVGVHLHEDGLCMLFRAACQNSLESAGTPPHVSQTPEWWKLLVLPRFARFVQSGRS